MNYVNDLIWTKVVNNDEKDKIDDMINKKDDIQLQQICKPQVYSPHSAISTSSQSINKQHVNTQSSNISISEQTTSKKLNIQLIECHDKDNEIEKEEELEKLKQITKDVATIYEINRMLAGILNEQSENLEEIKNLADETNNQIDISNDKLANIDNQKVAYVGTKLTATTIGTGIVSIIAVPIIGIKFAAVAAVVAAVSGTTWSLTGNTTQ
jgi:hypothetical protein